MIWSILIPTIRERSSMQMKLFDELEHQIGMRPIEVLSLLDNKKKSIGAKRNDLMSIATGNYVSFIDDDDWVEGEYVRSIFEVLEKDFYDVVTFSEIRQGIGIKTMRTTHSLDAGDGFLKEAPMYSYEPDHWTGLPSHLCVWKRDLIKDVKFEDKSWQEDFAWMKLARERVSSQYQICKDLYQYRIGHREKCE